jgi:hypothetical protein
MVVLKNDGTRFAGQGGTDDHAWEYTTSKGWKIVDKLAFGVEALLYLVNGTLLVNHKEAGSIGYRYQDTTTGRIYTGAETYSSPKMVMTEYTCRDGVCCGQGLKQNGWGIQCLFLATQKRVLLEAGISRFVRFNKVGDQIAIATAKFQENKAVVHWLTLSELEALPAFTNPTPVKSVSFPHNGPSNRSNDNNGDDDKEQTSESDQVHKGSRPQRVHSNKPQPGQNPPGGRHGGRPSRQRPGRVQGHRRAQTSKPNNGGAK